MSLKDYLKEVKFEEAEKVIYNGEEWEVITIGKMIEIVSKDAKEILKVLPGEIKKKK